MNSRTFSIAITAWSAKVLSSAICFSRESLGSRPVDTKPPTPRLRRRAAWGSDNSLRSPAVRARGADRTSGTLRSRFAYPYVVICRPRMASIALPGRRRPHGAGDRTDLPDQLGGVPELATRHTRPPSTRQTAVHRHHTAGPRSPRWRRTPAGGRWAKPLMTRRISLVAVCWSSASLSGALEVRVDAAGARHRRGMAPRRAQHTQGRTSRATGCPARTGSISCALPTRRARLESTVAWGLGRVNTSPARSIWRPEGTSGQSRSAEPTWHVRHYTAAS